MAGVWCENTEFLYSIKFSKYIRQNRKRPFRLLPNTIIHCRFTLFLLSSLIHGSVSFETHTCIFQQWRQSKKVKWNKRIRERETARKRTQESINTIFICFALYFHKCNIFSSFSRLPKHTDKSERKRRKEKNERIRKKYIENCFS